MIRQKLHEAQDGLNRRKDHDPSVQDLGEPAARSYMKSTQVSAWCCLHHRPLCPVKSLIFP